MDIERQYGLYGYILDWLEDKDFKNLKPAVNNLPRSFFDLLRINKNESIKSRFAAEIRRAFESDMELKSFKRYLRQRECSEVLVGPVTVPAAKNWDLLPDGLMSLFKILTPKYAFKQDSLRVLYYGFFAMAISSAGDFLIYGEKFGEHTTFLSVITDIHLEVSRDKRHNSLTGAGEVAREIENQFPSVSVKLLDLNQEPLSRIGRLKVYNRGNTGVNLNITEQCLDDLIEDLKGRDFMDVNLTVDYRLLSETDTYDGEGFLGTIAYFVDVFVPTYEPLFFSYREFTGFLKNVKISSSGIREFSPEEKKRLLKNLDRAIAIKGRFRLVFGDKMIGVENFDGQHFYAPQYNDAREQAGRFEDLNVPHLENWEVSSRHKSD